ncbi:MAG: HK97 gp10 family phage protein [Ruminococcus sp.]|nr:HK97 gp10 family phage protein [Ruminococcus sp.]
MADIKIIGLDKLEKQLKKNATLNDVKQAVKMSGTTLQEEAKRIVPVDSSNLKDTMIGPEISNGGMTVEVAAMAEYGEYVEYGTRYMEAQPYMRPALKKAEKEFRANMKKMVN